VLLAWISILLTCFSKLQTSFNTCWHELACYQNVLYWLCQASITKWTARLKKDRNSVLISTMTQWKQLSLPKSKMHKTCIQTGKLLNCLWDLSNTPIRVGHAVTWRLSICRVPFILSHTNMHTHRHLGHVQCSQGIMWWVLPKTVLIYFFHIFSSHCSQKTVMMISVWSKSVTKYLFKPLQPNIVIKVILSKISVF